MYDQNQMKKTPDWFKKGNIYQINPRTFSSEGTLCAITKELSFLADIGVKVVYLCPIFEADGSLTNWSTRQKASKTYNPKNPYRMNDFFKIDSEYGTIQDLSDLIKEAHRLDMKVMLDLVYLHFGPNADILKTHPEFALRDADGKIILTKWNFPTLNYESKGLREYLWCNMTYYVGVLDVDGFRCDVGDEVPLDFWKEGKRRIRAIKPDAVMLNEGKKRSHLEECFDANYAFSWHEAIYSVVAGAKPASIIRRDQELYVEQSNSAPDKYLLMRDIDNHDTVTDWPRRAEVVAGHNGMELIIALNYTMDGVPMVYSGNELGDTARLNMFANRFYTGGFETTDRTKKNEPYSVRRQNVIKNLNSFKSKSNTLCYGTVKWLNNSCEDRVLAFEREYNGEKITFICNISNMECIADIEGLDVVGGKKLFESETPVTAAEKNAFLPPYSYAIISKKTDVHKAEE